MIKRTAFHLTFTIYIRLYFHIITISKPLALYQSIKAIYSYFALL
ncbi:hypothetical protein PPBDW_II1016 [Photobacterium kishitanii]|nr:hypothetical protein PPBDW_II1016 [Photobacterium kishitanii]